MVVELQVYLGEKTPSTSVEDTAQYLLYKYTPFKDESEGSQQTSYCTDTIDVVNLFFFFFFFFFYLLNVRLYLNFGNSSKDLFYESLA